MATDQMIRLVAFDLGGVMINLAGGWESAAQHAGVPFRAFTLEPAQEKAFFESEWAYERGEISTAAFCTQVSELLGGLYTAAELQAMYLAVIQEEFAGIAEVVRDLQAAGYRTACLSNTCALHWPVLTDPTIYPGIGALDYQHASHLFGARKPDERVFRLFEQATGCAPAEILFFDDRADNIAAARGYGWHAVGISWERPAAEQIREALQEHLGI